jgi:hypothetical protein
VTTYRPKAKTAFAKTIKDQADLIRSITGLQDVIPSGTS